LLPEQFEKVIKINELIRQLDALGFDAEGENKVSGADEEDKTATKTDT
jgi:partner of Y14 and mago protein